MHNSFLDNRHSVRINNFTNIVQNCRERADDPEYNTFAESLVMFLKQNYKVDKFM